MQCLSCRSEIREASRFCPSCGAPTEGSRAATFAVPPRERPPSTGPLDGARFIPGTMLAGRYRIVGLLGRGGMGEVYRAEDLKLGQPVALKFLPEDVAKQPDRLARFHHEVRVARQVSHPNVCRVYDIGEADGQHFLSMEYVDGEDLASLLRRIGRLPSDKATELARQLCAGLAAAHDRGVLHRDLKPANVLIDGRGRARIADFGLAGLVDERRDPHIIAGTPGYMAPEQLAGQGTSARTDVYALGLVLYEMFTGKAAHKVAAAGPLVPGDPSPFPNPSTLMPDLDQAIERVILRCLETDPARRPSSALVVAAALPGGDPLAAALAAGETPSPDLVAAAGEEGSLSPAKGLALLVAILLGLIPAGWLSRQTSLAGLVTLDKGPEVLAERARSIARNLGYTDRAVDEAYGYAPNRRYLRYVAQHDPSADRWRVLKTNQPAALFFWYRQSPLPFATVASMATGRTTGEVTKDVPPQFVSGMLSIKLDPSGRLIEFLAAPPGIDESATAMQSPDWKRLFDEAGLPMARFSSRPPTRVPPVFADTRSAWEGVYVDRPTVPIRIEAAAAAGKPVYFMIVGPWTDPPATPTTPPRSLVAIFVLVIAVLVLAFVSAIMLARSNLRRGRGDVRGAARLGVFVLAINLLSTRLEPGLAGLFVIVNALADAVFPAALAFLMYIAIEPHVRRVWPETMIGWCRLLAGRFRDPLVGRDILIGALAGIVLACLSGLEAVVMPAWFGLPPRAPIPTAPEYALSGLLLGGLAPPILIAMATLPSFSVALPALLLLFIFSTSLRSRRMATVGVITIFTMYLFGGTFGSGNPFVAFFVAVMVAAGFVFVLVRYGLLPAIVCSFVHLVTGDWVPITLDSSAPYVTSSYWIIGTIVALAAYGFRCATAGRSVFAGSLLEEDPARDPKVQV